MSVVCEVRKWETELSLGDRMWSEATLGRVLTVLA